MTPRTLANLATIRAEARESLLAAWPSIVAVTSSLDCEIEVIDGGRTEAEQLEIYAQGRTKPGPIVTWTKKSKHMTGRAVDFGLFSNEGKTYVDAIQPLMARRVYRKIADIIEPQGWKWGNSFGDDPHFEFTGEVPAAKPESVAFQPPQQARYERRLRRAAGIAVPPAPVRRLFLLARMAKTLQGVVLRLFRR